MKLYKMLSMICVIYFSCFLSICFSEGAGLPMVENITITFNAGNFTVEKDNGYDIINMSEFSQRLVSGDPMLPSRTYNVLLPSEVDYLSLKLEVVSAKSRVHDGIFNIKPTPLSAPLTEDVSKVGNATGLDYATVEYNASRIPRSSVYSTDANYPENIVRLLVPGQMRKWKFVPVEFVPFQYNPVTGKLTSIESVTLNISYNLTGSSPAAVSELMADTVLDDQAPDMFVNYQESKGWYLGRELAKSEPSATIGYVIITTNAIRTNSAKLNAFVTHKQDLGYTVQVVTEDDFGSLVAPSPNYRADKIRQWLKDNYVSKKIMYVLLIGNPTPYSVSGEGDIPMKMCWPRYAETRYPEYKDCPTDAFYADLTGNWDKNGNGLFGELADYTAGGVDFAAEVYVGRIPVYNADYATLDSILQKMIDYESSRSTAWRKSALLPMSFSDSGTDGAYLAEQMKNNYLTSHSYSTWRMYQKGSGACAVNSAFSANQELRGGTIVRDRWAADDYGIMTWWGHGSSTSTSIGYSYCWDGEMMYSSYCPSLDDSHPSFAFLCSCLNGQPEVANNLQYSILKNGGIASVSATRVSWYMPGLTDFVMSATNSGFAYEYNKRLVEELAAGDALMQMRASMVPYDAEYLMNFLDFNIYGDPSISIKNDFMLSKIGVFRNGPWYLDYNGNRAWDPASGDVSFWFGTSGDQPVAGDWNGDGKDEIGVFRNGPWYLDYNGNRVWDPASGDVSFWFGTSGDLPVSGDWNGDGKDEIGVFRNGPWYLDYNGNRVWDPASGDVSFWLGTSGDLPVSGDWNGDGKDEIGVFRNGPWYLDYNGNRVWDPASGDVSFWFGTSGDKPVAGYWN
jgi:hypothetical protein